MAIDYRDKKLYQLRLSYKNYNGVNFLSYEGKGYALCANQSCPIYCYGEGKVPLHAISGKQYSNNFVTERTPHQNIIDKLPFLNTHYRHLPHDKRPPLGELVDSNTYYLVGNAQFKLVPFLLRQNYYRYLEYWFGRSYVEDSNKGTPIANMVEYANYTSAILEAIELSALGDGRSISWEHSRCIRVTRKNASYTVLVEPTRFVDKGIAILANHADMFGVLTKDKGGIGSVCL